MGMVAAIYFVLLSIAKKQRFIVPLLAYELDKKNILYAYLLHY
ncbi:MAG: hypothetical protein ACI9M1_000410 [Porticoccaceae bacterium]